MKHFAINSKYKLQATCKHLYFSQLSKTVLYEMYQMQIKLEEWSFFFLHDSFTSTELQIWQHQCPLWLWMFSEELQRRSSRPLLHESPPPQSCPPVLHIASHSLAGGGSPAELGAGCSRNAHNLPHLSAVTYNYTTSWCENILVSTAPLSFHLSV